jgi:hypothetical protein
MTCIAEVVAYLDDDSLAEPTLAFNPYATDARLQTGAYRLIEMPRACSRVFATS